jgi:hypothetical protein
MASTKKAPDLSQMTDEQLLAWAKQQRQSTHKDQAKVQQRISEALVSVFKSYAPGGKWLPLEFVLSFSVVRLKPSPASFATIREQVHTMLRTKPDYFEVAKGMGKGARMLDPLKGGPATKAKKVAKKAATKSSQ